MRPELIIEVDVAVKPLLRVTNRLVRVEIDLLILEAPPEALHEHVIPPAAAPIHTDLDALVFQYARELQAGKYTEKGSGVFCDRRALSWPVSSMEGESNPTFPAP